MFQTYSFSNLPHEVLESELRGIGAVRIRDIGCLEDFEVLTRHFCRSFKLPASRLVYSNFERIQAGDGFTSAVFGVEDLFAHSETAYSPNVTPQFGFIYSPNALTAAGGETFLLDGLEFAEAMDSELREELEARGIIYQMSWAPERWAIEFGISGLTELEDYLGKRGDCRWRLVAAGNLELAYNADAFTRLPSGELAFCNGILAHLSCVNHRRYPGLNLKLRPGNGVYFGDGSPLSAKQINHLIDLQDQLRIIHRWCSGDVLAFDNNRWMHGRVSQQGDGARCVYSRFGFI